MRNIFILLFVAFVCACSTDRSDKERVDALNDHSYDMRYKNVDSTRIYANMAYAEAEKIGYRSGMSEALLNQAFYTIARMDYLKSDTLLSRADSFAEDDITRLCVEVQRMRLCQRRSQNKDFYVRKNEADRYIENIHSDIEDESPRKRKQYTYARSEYGIVLSTYLYYVNLPIESSEALLSIAKDKDIQLHSDTAQYLGYLYNIGAGGILRDGTAEDIARREFDCLMQCYMLARHNGYLFWEANSLQSLSEHLANPEELAAYHRDDDPCIRFLNDDAVPDSMLSGNLAERSLQCFVRYGDIYQIAGGWRTLASCYHDIKDHEAELSCLLNAVDDSLILQAPDLVASISEKMSMAYSALGEKQASDYYRNQYLDMQDSTRQDRQLEARAEELSALVSRTELLITAIVIVLSILVVALAILIHFHRKNKDKYKHNERLEELGENLQALSLQTEDALRINVEQHAKVTYAENIMPLIDRMLHSVENASKSGIGNLEYVSDVCKSILEYNAQLTSWVQLRKGQVSLHVETFPLQSLFSIIKMNVKSFNTKGVRLSVQDTDISIKADKVLTLFLINTIVDNARKYTPEGGEVVVSATKCESFDGYAEVSIEDSGKGMTQEQADHLFDYGTIIDQKEDLTEQKSHGFGLMNCRGIMDRYRKTSELFSHCEIKAESEKGKGTRILFRLPIAVRATLVVLLAILPAFSFANKNNSVESAWADSVYNANVEGRYAEAISYADSCFRSINKSYRTLKCVNVNDTLTITYNGAELRWWTKKVAVDYDIIIYVRNEVAVSALALNDWDLYNANNKAYTKLYKECSQDSTLSTYCATMERTENTNNLAMVVLVLLFLGLVAVFWLFYVRDVLHNRRNLDQICREKEENIAKMTRERDRLYVSNNVIDNTLSALKHETMYFPSRIAQDNSKIMTSEAIDEQGVSELSETVGYYRNLYSMLCTQCIRNASEISYPMAPFAVSSLKLDFSGENDGVEIIANKQLMDYLVLLLKRKNNRETPSAEIILGGGSNLGRKYITLAVDCFNIRMLKADAEALFSLATKDVDYLIMRQILRENGTATNAFAIGIRAEVTDKGYTRFIITLLAK
ncbi:MAG: DUF5112 domain-containing protein [Prevotellaceae bacterium]|nr:DUF5112 domain-containing protein [Prevotellaceae bacterium]